MLEIETQRCGKCVCQCLWREFKLWLIVLSTLACAPSFSLFTVFSSCFFHLSGKRKGWKLPNGAGSISTFQRPTSVTAPAWIVEGTVTKTSRSPLSCASFIWAQDPRTQICKICGAIDLQCLENLVLIRDPIKGKFKECFKICSFRKALLQNAVTFWSSKTVCTKEVHRPFWGELSTLSFWIWFEYVCDVRAHICRKPSSYQKSSKPPCWSTGMVSWGAWVFVKWSSCMKMYVCTFTSNA